MLLRRNISPKDLAVFPKLVLLALKSKFVLFLPLLLIVPSSLLKTEQIAETVFPTSLDSNALGAPMLLFLSLPTGP
jgi:hypothetical protein